jgi:hypothetical protein
MAVSATGTGFNATILDYKDWLEYRSPEDIDALGRELAQQTTTNKKGVRFFYDTVDRTIVYATHPGRTAVQGYFKRNEYEEADDKRAYVERCISLAIIAYMELVSLQNKTTGFWRHNYNQGLIVHNDAPHLTVDDIIDIASRSIDDEMLRGDRRARPAVVLVHRGPTDRVQGQQQAHLRAVGVSYHAHQQGRRRTPGASDI